MHFIISFSSGMFLIDTVITFIMDRFYIKLYPTTWHSVTGRSLLVSDFSCKTCRKVIFGSWNVKGFERPFVSMEFLPTAKQSLDSFDLLRVLNHTTMS